MPSVAFLSGFWLGFDFRHDEDTVNTFRCSWDDWTGFGIPGDCIIYCISSSKSTFIWVMHGYSTAPPCSPWAPCEVEQVFFVNDHALHCWRILLGPGTKETHQQHTMQTVDFNFICIFLYESKLVSIKTVFTTVCCCFCCCCCWCFYRRYVYVMPHGAAAADWWKLLYINFSDRSFWMLRVCVGWETVISSAAEAFPLHPSMINAKCATRIFYCSFIVELYQLDTLYAGKSGWTGGLFSEKAVECCFLFN